MTCRLGVLILLSVLASPLGAAVIHSIDGEPLMGTLVSCADGTLTVAVNSDDGSVRQVMVSLDDVVAIGFREQSRAGVAGGSTLVVDNDGQHPMKMEMGVVDLKKGKHEITVLYYHAKDVRGLRLAWSGPGFQSKTIGSSSLSHLKPGADKPAPRGFTPQGLRLPDDVPDTQRSLNYAYYENPDPRPWTGVADMLTTKPKTTGFVSRVDLGPAERADDFGLAFTGYIEAPADGRYTFYLNSDCGSQLYIGPMPPRRGPGPPQPRAGIAASGPASRPAGDATPWRVHLAGADRVTGPVAQWSEKEITILSPAASEPVTIPFDQVRELWRGDAPRPKQGAGAAELEDTAWVVSDGKMQPVGGVALGIDGDSLRFRYNGQDRRIKLDRLAGVVLAARPVVPDDAPRDTFTLDNGDTVTGRWTGLDDTELTIEPAWAGKLQLVRRQVVRLDVRNGRLIYLSDLSPVKVEQVPFFDRVVPYRLDSSLLGGRIRLSDGEHDKGVAMHSRCLLQYDLKGGYQSFRAKVGFQQPEGRAGAAAVRVVGDGRTLFEEADLRGDQPPRDVELKITGVKALTLEVDYGRGQDVADHVIWADARLIRPR